MIDLQKVADFLYEYFPQVTTSGDGTHFVARCIFCGDSKKSTRKKRFNVDYKNGNPIYHCFNCGVSGNFIELYANVKGLDLDEARKQLIGFDKDRIVKSLTDKTETRETKELEYENHGYILDDCLKLDSILDSHIKKKYHRELVKFHVERKISPKKFKIFVAYKGKYKNRFIIPIYNEDRKIIYFQGRAMNESVIPKYKNPPTEKSTIIFNQYKFDKNKYIIVAEGLIDAMMIKNQGTAGLGKEISEDFLKLLFPLTDRGIILAFDNDEPGYESMMKFMVGVKKRKKPANKYAKVVKYFLYPPKVLRCNDINNIRTETDIEDIYKFICDNSYDYTKAYARLKMNGRKLF